jgi:quercetin dioxygenase-like cupin family protein
MADSSKTKVEASTAPTGPEGQKYLASGRALSMRLWEGEAGGTTKEPVRRDYETIGYVVSGRAELELEGQTVALAPGSSWVVPKGASHTYRILETFTAVEATAATPSDAARPLGSPRPTPP